MERRHLRTGGLLLGQPAGAKTPRKRNLPGRSRVFFRAASGLVAPGVPPEIKSRSFPVKSAHLKMYRLALD